MSTVTAKKKRGRSQKVEPVVEPPALPVEPLVYPDPLFGVTVAPAPPPEQPKGIACPQCGCCDLRVDKTRPKVNGVVRWRYCRHCGRSVRIRTEERAVYVDPRISDHT